MEGGSRRVQDIPVRSPVWEALDGEAATERFEEGDTGEAGGDDDGVGGEGVRGAVGGDGVRTEVTREGVSIEVTRAGV
ncbi:MAG: hypothetical protein R3F14_46745 [Polyangiaceae bacterium]